jgi:hypothetical protein
MKDRFILQWNYVWGWGHPRDTLAHIERVEILKLIPLAIIALGSYNIGIPFLYTGYRFDKDIFQLILPRDSSLLLIDLFLCAMFSFLITWLLAHKRYYQRSLQLGEQELYGYCWRKVLQEKECAFILSRRKMYGYPHLKNACLQDGFFPPFR